MEHSKLYYRNDIKQWYLADNIDYFDAKELDIYYNMKRVKDNGFEVLSNNNAKNFDPHFNFIVAHWNKEYLLKVFGNLFNNTPKAPQ